MSSLAHCAYENQLLGAIQSDLIFKNDLEVLVVETLNDTGL